MLKQYKKSAFSLIALLAITLSMFRTNVGDVVLSASHKPFHSTKTTALSSLHTSSTLLLLEMDSEEAVDGEESDDDLKPVVFEFTPFTTATFAALESAAASHPHYWSAATVKGYYAPIYLLNRNFRL